jgi:hypothetical protein
MDPLGKGLSIGLGWIQASHYRHGNRYDPRPNFGDMLLTQTPAQLTDEMDEKL